MHATAAHKHVVELRNALRVASREVCRRYVDVAGLKNGHSAAQTVRA